MNLTIYFPTDLWFYVTGYFAVGLIALTKSAFGGGIAMIGIPVMALAMPPLEAAIILGPMYFFMDMFAIGAYRNESWSKPDVFSLWPGILIGTAMGAMFFIYVSPDIVASTIGLVALLFCIHWFFRGRLQNSTRMPINHVLALATGTASGFTSFIAHAGGPPVVTYMLRRGLDKTVYSGTLIIVLALGNFVKAVPYAIISMQEPGLIWKSIALTPIVPPAVWLGKVLHDRLSQETLYFWCYLLLAGAALKMTVEAGYALLD